MNKKVLLTLAAFGGLALIAITLPETSNNDVSVTVKEDEAVSVPGEVNSNFPIYPGVKTLNITTTNGEDGRIFHSLSLESKDSIQEINEWYREALNSNSWSIKSDKNVGGYQIIQGEKDGFFTSLQAAMGQTDGTVVISQQAQIRP